MSTSTPNPAAEDGRGAPAAALAPAGAQHRRSGGPSGVSVRSRVDETPEVDEHAERRKLLARYSGRQVARDLLRSRGLGEHRVARCGFSLGERRTFELDAGGRGRVTNVERCRNSRLCPVCGPAEAAVRAAEVGAAVWRWMTDHRGEAVFVSIAASHQAGDRLEDHHRWLLAARAAVMRSNSYHWRRFRQLFGVVDVAWRIEHSIGPNGPHVGLHLVLLLRRWWEAIDAQRAEAWLVLAFRRELAALGSTAWLAANAGIDVVPVDDPAGLGRYLTKWGIGRELATETDKQGRNGVNVPVAAVPALLAEDHPGMHYRKARHAVVRRWLAAWDQLVTVASDPQRWYRGFRTLTKLVPELVGLSKPREIIAAATDVLPVDLRPPTADDPEGNLDGVEGGSQQLHVTSDAWTAALRWWRANRTRHPLGAMLRRTMLPGTFAPVPLELAVVWWLEQHGLEVTAHRLGAMAAGDVDLEHHDGRPDRWTVHYPGAPT